MFSQTTEYALRAMAWLAVNEGELVPTNEIATHTMVPPHYLAKVLQQLASSDLITGRRGVRGGYRLARSPRDISLLEVMRSVGTIERITSCPLGLENHGTNLCALHRRIDETARLVIERFEGISLFDLISEKDSNRPLCDVEATQRVSLTIQGGGGGTGGGSGGGGKGRV